MINESPDRNEQPSWLVEWQSVPLPETEALAIFESLPSVSSVGLRGLWRGRGLKTGHPLDGVLENLGWYGKLFRDDGRADPLLFSGRGNSLAAIDPARIPLKLALKFSALGRTRIMRGWFAYLQRALRAIGPAARLRDLDYHGVRSAAMVYDQQPIIDYFRQVDADTVVGLMEMRPFDRRYFFLLRRVSA